MNLKRLKFLFSRKKYEDLTPAEQIELLKSIGKDITKFDPEDDFHDEMLLPPEDRYLKLIQGGKTIRAKARGKVTGR